MSNPSGSVLQPQGIVYISLSFGMSLLVVAWAFYRISGGLFNPAVRTSDNLANFEHDH
jgi:aquaporin rerated protein, other eukaryote